jgi:hypothetical protein
MLDAKESPITVAVEGGPQEGLTWKVDEVTKRVAIKLDVQKTPMYKHANALNETLMLLFGATLFMFIIMAIATTTHKVYQDSQLTACNATVTEQATLLGDYREKLLEAKRVVFALNLISLGLAIAHAIPMPGYRFFGGMSVLLGWMAWSRPLMTFINQL